MTSSNEQGLHPFFNAPSRRDRALDENTADTAVSDQHDSNEPASLEDHLGLDGADDGQPAKRKRKTKTKESAASSAALMSFLGVKQPNQPHVGPCQNTEQIPKARKRARLSGSEEDVGTAVNENDDALRSTPMPHILNPAQTGIEPILLDRPEEQDIIHMAPAEQDSEVPAQVYAAGLGSRKVLKLDGKGGFGSPREIKQTLEIAPAAPAEKQRKSRRKKCLAVLRYGRTVLSDRIQLGKKINHIFGQPPRPVTVLTAEEVNVDAPKDQTMPTKRPRGRPRKATHPFFAGETQGQGRSITPPLKSTSDHQDQPSPNTFKSFTTPGKLRSQARISHALKQNDTSTHRGPLPSRIFSLPGTVFPAWPAKDHVHIRPRKAKGEILPPRPRRTLPSKRKQKNRLIAETGHFSTSAKPVSSVLSDLRASHPMLPERMIVTGPNLQQSVEAQLQRGQKSSLTHPAIARLHSSVVSYMTPYDLGCYETQAWAQKYAPRSAAEVLQFGKEATVLRDWLESQTTAFLQSKSLKNSEDEKAKRKKKRKRKENGLDSFIVDSSDEDVEMQSLEGGEDDQADNGTSVELRSMVRGAGLTSDGLSAQKANAVLLCGPHGCGKTAAVYAAAKELGFEVFEVSSNGRRSGKDIIEKVGDMSMNHQVRRERASTTGSVDGAASETDMTIPTEPDEKQSTLASFFGAVKKEKKENKPSKKQEQKLAQLAKLREMASSQKQSLILVEEADVLFEEDKQFWDTIISLATQSRRPIVLTCNAERLVPQEDLSLHAVLRFRPPPKELVVDYLLLVAALEGHLLKREAVASLYDSRHSDLRATLMDLHFWCQMAVGDDKGGVDWLLQRWPKGVDEDHNGQTLRVISSNTYRPGMNVYGQPNDGSCHDEDFLLNAWREWGVEPAAVVDQALGMPTESEKGFSCDHHAELRAYSRTLDSISALDITTSTDLPRSEATSDSLDCTLPKIDKKSSANYVSGYKLLRAAIPAVDYEQFDTEHIVYVAMKLKDQLDGFRIMFSESPVPFKSNPRLALREELTPSITAGTIYTMPSANPTTTRNQLNTALSPLLEHHPSPSTFLPLILDTAPYIRNIVAYDLALERQRDLLNTTLHHSSQNSAGSGGEGKAAKRARTTRASRSALEGGKRAQTRRERWFANAKGLDLGKVLRTAGAQWPQGIVEGEGLREASVEPAVVAGQVG